MALICPIFCMKHKRPFPEMNDIKTLTAEAIEKVSETIKLDALDAVRVQYLGKKGSITGLMKQIGSLSPEERKTFGASVNEAKQQVQSAIDHKKSELERLELDQKLATETVDMSAPVRPVVKGSVHPISHVIEEALSIFATMGFEVTEGPEIEDDHHNFNALNIPQNHPARQMQDTFYLNAEQEGKPLLLRTHTSSVQIRSTEGQKPPFKFVAPGRVYRSDYDLTHTPMFHQIEALYIDKEIHMGHLKGCLHQFLKAFFELDEVPIRFRPSYFPFTEPSAEVDIGCRHSRDGTAIGAGDDWLEILGCGMVHPNVLKNIGVDPDEYQGFAFGVGIERLAMLKYGAPDLREFFNGDIRWLSHYGFASLSIPNRLGGLS